MRTTTKGQLSRILRLEAASPGGTEQLSDRERGRRKIDVCAAWCLTPAETDQFRAFALSERYDDALALIAHARVRLAEHFDDLTPPPSSAAPCDVRAWADAWNERAEDWAPDAIATENDTAAAGAQ